MLTVIDITVVLYFFLLLFKFLYAITPPVLNIDFIILGVCNFFEVIFTSFELLKFSIGLTFEAFFAEDIKD